jgi:hypothetical protein
VFKKFNEKLTVRVVSLQTFIAMGLLQAQSAAAQGLGEVGENIASNIPGLAKAALWGGMFVGVVFFVMGLIEIPKVNKGQGTWGDVAKKCFVGAALLGASALIGRFSGTMFGSNESSGGLSDLGL